MTVKRDLVDEINRMTPAAAHAQLGAVIDQLITAYNALLAKLDADTGVADTNYASTLRVQKLAERS